MPGGSARLVGPAVKLDTGEVADEIEANGDK